MKSVRTRLECRSGLYLAVNDAGIVQEIFRAMDRPDCTLKSDFEVEKIEKGIKR